MRNWLVPGLEGRLVGCAVATEAVGPVGLDDLGGGVAQRGADLVDLDLVNGALLAFPGLIGTLAQPPADNDAHAPLQALRDVLRRLPPDIAAQEEAVAVLPLAGGVVAEARRGGHPEGGDRLARGGVAQFGVADQVADDRYLGVTCCHLRLRSSGIVQYRRYREGLSVVLHAQDLGPQNRLVQTELAIEFRDGVRHSLHVDNRVYTLAPLVDLVGEAPATPHVNLVHAPASRGNHGQELLQGWLDGVFLEARVEDDHHFVMAHKRKCPLWTDGHGLSVTGGTASTRAGCRPGRDTDA